MKKTNAAKITAGSLFILYAAVMLYLLLIQRFAANGFSLPREPDYAQALLARIEPVPFRTIVEFIGRLENFTIGDLAYRNLVGNVVLFVPIGVFLPVLFPKQRRFGMFLLTTALTITAVELTQLFTLLGTCDIDDLILNTAGASIGYALYRLFARRKQG
ncbi:MAG: VanZ family protein [Ruminiclostridium sp.]|nr:VanZ family protein [Ruminiclostridium sp.]